MQADRDSLLKGVQLLDIYISGADRSEEFAGRISVFFDESFSDSDLLEELVIAAASYEPTGGELLHDEKSFLSLCIRVKLVLETQLSAQFA